MSFKLYSQNQITFLPPALSDLVPQNHLARVVSEVVDSLDLTSFYSEYSDEGCSAYNPTMLLKVIFYSYAVGIRSSRKIAKKLEEDVIFMWLSGNQKPDFRTISDFRKDRLNHLKRTFAQIVVICKNLGMIKVGTVSIDSTAIKANASAKKTRNKEQLYKELKEIEKEMKKALQEAIIQDEREDEIFGEDKRGDEIPKNLQNKEVRIEKIRKVKEKLKRAQKIIEKENLVKINTTDPEAKFVRLKSNKKKPGFNNHIATENQVIITYKTTDQAADYPEFQNIVKEVKENTGQKPIRLLTDSAYCSQDNLQYVEDEEIDGYMPDSIKVAKESKEENKYQSKFNKENFKYSKEDDIYICPAGKKLRCSSKARREYRRYEAKEEDCLKCKYKPQCTKGKHRVIKRNEILEELRTKMREKLDSKEGKEIYKQRIHEPEPVFGNIKYNLNFSQFLLRGLKKAEIEFGLACIGHNIKKIGSYLVQGGITYQLEGVGVTA